MDPPMSLSGQGIVWKGSLQWNTRSVTHLFVPFLSGRRLFLFARGRFSNFMCFMFKAFEAFSFNFH